MHVLRKYLPYHICVYTIRFMKRCCNVDFLKIPTLDRQVYHCSAGATQKNDITRSSQYFQNSVIAVNATPIRANQPPLNITKVMKTIFKTHSNVERFKRNNPTVIKAQTFIELILGIVDILQFGKRKFQNKMKE
uniref:Uncharacterized protein n=1 Tax=Glossina pallidipes TaxID=7398 RepID=A0A1B0A8J4_GLOPL